MTDMSKNDDGTFKLDPLGIVSDWYNKGNIHDTTSLEDIGKFIILHTMFIITFLELLVKCYIKYRNRLAKYI